MKKYIIILLATLAFTACDEKDDDPMDHYRMEGSGWYAFHLSFEKDGIIIPGESIVKGIQYIFYEDHTYQEFSAEWMPLSVSQKVVWQYVHSTGAGIWRADHGFLGLRDSDGKETYFHCILNLGDPATEMDDRLSLYRFVNEEPFYPDTPTVVLHRMGTDGLIVPPGYEGWTVVDR